MAKAFAQTWGFDCAPFFKGMPSCYIVYDVLRYVLLLLSVNVSLLECFHHRHWSNQTRRLKSNFYHYGHFEVQHICPIVRQHVLKSHLAFPLIDVRGVFLNGFFSSRLFVSIVSTVSVCSGVREKLRIKRDLREKLRKKRRALQESLQAKVTDDVDTQVKSEMQISSSNASSLSFFLCRENLECLT